MQVLPSNMSLHTYQTVSILKTDDCVVLSLLVENARRLSDKLQWEFTQISRKIQHRPNNIEELTQQKDYTNVVPKLISALKKKINKMGQHYDLIEDFNFSINHDDFDQKWTVIGWPKRIHQQIEESAVAHERLKKKFEKELADQQEIFLGNINELSRDISILSRYKESEKVEEVITIVSLFMQ